jgi:hypothetical protein
MDNLTTVRPIPHEIAKCPHCQQSHVFQVLVRARVTAAPGTPLFGGGRPATTLAFTCPVTRRIISEPVPDLPEGEVVGIDSTDRSTTVAPSGSGAAASPVDLEFAEWIKASRTTALDFCKSMLAASTGAVPVYFAVLKYLGTETAKASWFSIIAAAPPLLFLAAAIVFALALRPRYGVVKRDNFEEFRRMRLEQLNRSMLTGLVLFSSALLIAIVLALRAIEYLVPHAGS